jgi:hypothetical protein
MIASQGHNCFQAGRSGVFFTEVLMDLSNVLHACHVAGLKLTHVKGLVALAHDELAGRLGLRPWGEIPWDAQPAPVPSSAGGVAVCRTVRCYGSLPTNYHQDSEEEAAYQRRSIRRLRTQFGFHLELYGRDYRGFHLSSVARSQSLIAAERSFVPHEKEVDTALVASLFRNCCWAKRTAPSGVLVVSGDLDLAPGIRMVRRCRPDIIIAVAAFDHNLAREYRNTRLTGQPPIILNRYLAIAEHGAVRMPDQSVTMGTFQQANS